jgi:hypothetical protein
MKIIFFKKIKQKIPSVVKELDLHFKLASKLKSNLQIGKRSEIQGTTNFNKP